MKRNLFRTSLFVVLAAAIVYAQSSPPIGEGGAMREHGRERAPRYIVTDLGTLGGPGTNSQGYQMNNAGWVAGSSNLIPGGPQHAFLWYGAGLLRDLGTLDGRACRDCNSAADGPNARGEAAIGSETSKPDPNGEDFCEYGTHLQCLGAIWKDGVMTPLPTLPGGNNGNAFNLNNRGVVVGFSETGVRDSTCLAGGTPFQVFRFEAVIWSPKGEIRQLRPLPGDTVGFAFGINDKGQAVGSSGLCSNTSIPPSPSGPHAVLWDSDRTPIDLGHLAEGSTRNIASSINNRGEVVGGAQAADGTVHTFLWTKDTGMQDLGAFPGAFVTVAPCCNTINDRGDVVGLAISPGGVMRALVWQDRGPLDLNTLIPTGSPWYLTAASSINNAGQITGSGTINGEMHAFLATPTHPRGRE